MMNFLKSLFSSAPSPAHMQGGCCGGHAAAKPERDVIVLDAYKMGEDEEEEQAGGCCGGGCGSSAPAKTQKPAGGCGSGGCGCN